MAEQYRVSNTYGICIVKRGSRAARSCLLARVMVNIINAANTIPDIWNCEPSSVITAALNASTMRLSLSPSIGHAAILPFDTSVKVNGQWQKVKKANLIVMVRGVKELAMRTNKYRVLNPFMVYFGQEWEENQMTGVGRPVGPIKDKSKVIGYGAYLQLFSGFEATVYKTRLEILAHAQRYSKSWNNERGEFNAKSRWATDFDQMATKTVLKDLIMNHGVIAEEDKAMLDKIADDGGDYIEAETESAPYETIEAPRHTEAENMAALGYTDEPKPAAQPAPVVTAQEYADLLEVQDETEPVEIDYRERHAQLWKQASAKKLITTETAKDWAVKPNMTAEEVAMKCQMIEMALQ